MHSFFKRHPAWTIGVARILSSLVVSSQSGAQAAADEVPRQKRTVESDPQRNVPEIPVDFSMAKSSTQLS